MKIQTVGIDIGKTVFHLGAMDERGKVVARKRFSRTQLLAYTVNLAPCLIGMEACCGAHYLGRILVSQGHTVRLIPAQFVKPFLKSNKNDCLDAEAIAEAVQRPSMRFVPLKSEEQLDLQALHRVRDRLVSRRTSIINQIRAFLLERGITFRQGRLYLRKNMPAILENAEITLSPRMRDLIHELWQEWLSIEAQIDHATGEIERIAKHDARLPAAFGRPRRGFTGRDRHGCRHRQRIGIREGARVCSLARFGSKAVLHWRKIKVAGNQ